MPIRARVRSRPPLQRSGPHSDRCTIGANGAYTYSVPNSATQSLGADVTKVDTFTVKSQDGTTQAGQLHDPRRQRAAVNRLADGHRRHARCNGVWRQSTSRHFDTPARPRSRRLPVDGLLTLAAMTTRLPTAPPVDGALALPGLIRSRYSRWTAPPAVSFTIHGTTMPRDRTPVRVDVTEDVMRGGNLSLRARSVSDAIRAKARSTGAAGNFGTLTVRWRLHLFGRQQRRPVARAQRHPCRHVHDQIVRRHAPADKLQHPWRAGRPDAERRDGQRH